MPSAYRKAKVWYLVRYRFLPWCAGQVPGFVLGILLTLVLVGMVLPSLLQKGWDMLYEDCTVSGSHFTCKLRNSHGH